MTTFKIYKSRESLRSGQVDKTRAENLPFRGPFYSRVIASGGAEKVKTQSLVGTRTTSFPYAFNSGSSWIRGQPQVGTVMLSQISSESNELTPVSYFDPLKVGAAEAYTKVADNLKESADAQIPSILGYRPLSPGDVDLGSGNAQTFLGTGDLWSARGGLSHVKLVSSRATISTPLMIVEGPHHRRASAINDEQRFGAVMRAAFGGSATNPRPVAYQGAIAKELTQHVSWLGIPGTLIDHRQGIVIGDDGLPIKGSSGNDLRALFRWVTALSELREEIDSLGNRATLGGIDATEGGRVSWPVGHQRFSVGRNFEVSSGADSRVSARGSVYVDGFTGFQIKTPLVGTIEGTAALNIKSNGLVSINTPLPFGVQVGAGPNKYPVLLANPTYLSTLNTLYAATVATLSALTVYSTAAAASWTAVATLLSGPASIPPAAAAAAASAMAALSTAEVTAVTAHVATLVPNPVGALSTKMVSE